MKLSAILRAIVRPYIKADVDERSVCVQSVVYSGPGFYVTSQRGWCERPLRATVRRIGDLEVAYWGRDTLVHPAPEAS